MENKTYNAGNVKLYNYWLQKLMHKFHQTNASMYMHFIFHKSNLRYILRKQTDYTYVYIVQKWRHILVINRSSIYNRVIKILVTCLNMILYNIIRYNTISYDTIPYHMIQYHTMQYHLSLVSYGLTIKGIFHESPFNPKNPITCNSKFMQISTGNNILPKLR